MAEVAAIFTLQKESERSGGGADGDTAGRNEP